MKYLSDEYREQLQELHANSKAWGRFGKALFPVCTFLHKYNITRLIDYGCGKGTIAEKIEVGLDYLFCYDPGNPENCLVPTEKQQGVICAAVMEHVEEEYVENVLEHIRSLTEEYAFFLIETDYADRFLPDGRNTHITIKTTGEWIQLLDKYFNLIEAKKYDDKSFTYVGTPKQQNHK